MGRLTAVRTARPAATDAGPTRGPLRRPHILHNPVHKCVQNMGMNRAIRPKIGTEVVDNRPAGS